MRILKMREILPERRRSWTQEVVIGGHVIQLGFGEYEDGRLGEIFIDISHEGTFLRGVLGTLARTVSISLQHGASVEMVAHALQGIDYPPFGAVQGSPNVTECYSVTDYVAREMLAAYGLHQGARAAQEVQAAQVEEVDKLTKKEAGFIKGPDVWRQPV